MNSWREYQLSIQRIDSREYRRKAFAARVAGVCIAAVLIGALLAIVWPR